MSDLTPERREEVRNWIAIGLDGRRYLSDLLAALDAAEKERDEANDRAHHQLVSRREALARVAALEKALTIAETSKDNRTRQIAREALTGSPPPVTPAPHCRYCGSLDWTVTKYGRVTHKQYCPHRTDPWHQGDPLVRQHEDDGA